MEVPRRPSLSMKMQRSLTKVKKSIQRITVTVPLGDSAKYAQMVFNNFDKNKDGIVTFGDLLLGIATIVKGTTDEKLKWIFQ
ncbi:hypothetical protein M0802_013653 [Mischocyttarus mexicanus]|nr:hypothetical protein M0802_013653 [Mischocyttarus mexicanus]